MGHEPKEVKSLVLIGIVCDDEIKDIIDLKTVQDRSKAVRENRLMMKNLHLIVQVEGESSNT